MDEKEVLSVYEAAELLRLHPKTVYKLAASGQIPGKRIGNSWRFRRSQILAEFDVYREKETNGRGRDENQ